MDICCGGQTSSRDYYHRYAHHPPRDSSCTTTTTAAVAAGMDVSSGGSGGGSGDNMTPAVERGRSVRERLEATLAGLGELDYLRARQDLLVRGALDSGWTITTTTTTSRGGGGDPVRPSGGSGTARAAGGSGDDALHGEDPYLSCEEKLLEENILLLRKQLEAGRRPDQPLQELDRQISDLRLDTDISHDHMETDSRPSSGFYDLSDGVNGSLSNSSNSVFSECLSSSRSSTADELVGYADCEGLLVLGIPYEDQSSSGTVRRSLSAPYASSSLDLPPLHPPTTTSSSLDPQAGQQTTRYQCDLVARHGSDVYRYPSPLHAVAVQSPMFFQTLGASGHHQGLPQHVQEAPLEGHKADCPPPPPLPRVAASASAPQVHQSSSWSTAPPPHPPPPPSSCVSSQSPSGKRLEGYIFGLLQRRSQPLRPNKPRTSISTDPGKSIHRQASLCGRPQGPGLGQGTLRGSEPRTTGWQAGAVLAGTASSEGGHAESKREEQAYRSQEQTQNGCPASNGDPAQNGFSVNGGTQQAGYSAVSGSGLNGYAANNCDVHHVNNNGLLEKKALSSGSKATGTPPGHYKDLGSPAANSSPKEPKHCPLPSTTDPDPPVRSPRTVKPQTATPQKSPNNKALPLTPNGKGDRSPPELVSLGSSSQSQDEGGGAGGHMAGGQHLPAQRHAAKLRKSGGGGKSHKTNSRKSQPIKAGRSSEHLFKSDRTPKHRGSSQRRTPQHDKIIAPHHHPKVSKRGSAAAGGGVGGGAPGGPSSASRLKRIPEDQVFLDKPIATSTLISNAGTKCGASRESKHNHHHRAHHGSSHHNHHHHHHGREPVVVVAKPKYKRNDYRHLRAMAAELPYDEAFRRAQRRQRKELLLSGQNQNSGTTATVYLTTAERRHYASPYAYNAAPAGGGGGGAGSDSEYSAECASLFHSTIMDTSEDEERRSNYTTNRFGDSESSESEAEFEGDGGDDSCDASSVSDSQESGAGGGGGAGGWTRAAGAAAVTVAAGGSGATRGTTSPALVKIKASRNLKKRILRFKSGSLKLMTTV